MTKVFWKVKCAGSNFKANIQKLNFELFKKQNNFFCKLYKKQKSKILRSSCHKQYIYFAIFDPHLTTHLRYSCMWAQNINAVRRLIILQKKTLRIMNFKNQLFHSNPLFSSKNILKFGDKITLENILFVSKSMNRQVLPIFNDWFKFSRNLHRYETCWLATNHLNIPTFRTQKYGHFSI